MMLKPIEAAIGMKQRILPWKYLDAPHMAVTAVVASP